MITYTFTNTGSDSLYEYLYKCIKNDILQGTIKAGEKLPSKRTFAKNLGISVITVENAYEQLIAEGYIYSIPKKGFYVTDLKKEVETEKIRKAKQYIQEHYSEPITQEEVSSAVGLSPAYFSVLFKKTEGEGFARYLINVRMEQAKILLRESNSPVSEICRLVGYNDVKHFTHTFEKAAGVKPAVYRKLYG